MPVGLSLFASIFATVGFFVSVFAVIVMAVEARRFKAKPKIALCPGATPGTLGVWVNWDPGQFALQVYRLRISHVSPNSKAKEGTFTVTFDGPQTEPFIGQITLPEAFKNMLERDANERALLSFEFRTVEEMSLCFDVTLKKAKQIYRGLKGKMPNIKNVLAPLGQDVATVFSLDYSELQLRKARMKTLEAAAAAKAAKAALVKAAAPAVPAAAAVTATAPVSAAPAPVAASAEVQGATPAAPKSVRDVVSASNKGQSDKGGDK